MKHSFTLPLDDYKRDISLLDSAITDSAEYLSRMEGISIDAAKGFIKSVISEGGECPLQDTPIQYLIREKEACREVKEGGFLNLIQKVADEELLLSPVLVAYHPPSKDESLHAKYINKNNTLRNHHKQLMFRAMMAQDIETEKFENIMQGSTKIKCNSLSGAQQATGTVISNRSAHPTLTSTCRAATGYGNANNEKFLAGNRHYWHPEIALANILSIIRHTDMGLLKSAMTQFQIHYPSIDETYDSIMESCKPYWREPELTRLVYDLIETLSDIERAAVLYVSDMYHLAKYNDKLVRGLLGRLIEPATTPHPDPKPFMKSVPNSYRELGNLLCVHFTKGVDFAKIADTNPEGYAIIANTVLNIITVLDEYALLIKALWVTPNMPSSIYRFPDIVRKAAIVSDTDSTIFSNDFWVVWYRGQLDFSSEAVRISNVTTFLAALTVSHVLITMSTHMGAKGDHKLKLEMKNEYFFPLFGTTSMAKHYFAYRSSREGNVFAEMDKEIKGKNLRDSTLPPYIRKGVDTYTSYVMDKIMQDGSISIHDVLTPIIRMERTLIDNIINGGYDDMPTLMIKTKEVYTNQETNNYMYHDMWQTVFAPKYGICEEPPYKGIKVSVDLNNPTKLNRWVEGITDPGVKERMGEWLTNNKKTNLGLFVIPVSMAQQVAIPEEIIPAIHYRKLVAGTLMPFYMVLESLGIFIVGANLCRLVSDIYDMDKAKLLVHELDLLGE